MLAARPAPKPPLLASKIAAITFRTFSYYKEQVQLRRRLAAARDQDHGRLPAGGGRAPATRPGLSSAARYFPAVEHLVEMMNCSQASGRNERTGPRRSFESLTCQAK